MSVLNKPQLLLFILYILLSQVNIETYEIRYYILKSGYYIESLSYRLGRIWHKASF